MASHRPTVAVVGGGASGVLVAAHLLSLPELAPLRLVLFERTGRLGAGAAFSTEYDSHLLNVTAGSMSAFPDDPEQFVRWLNSKGRPGAADDFVPRKLYRAYLRDVLWSRANSNMSRHSLEVRQDAVVDIAPTAGGAHVVPAHSELLRADAVILAPGVISPRFPPGLVARGAEGRCVTDPWNAKALTIIDPNASVTIMGTGLSAIDVLLALQENGHRGPVHAISRHGLLPKVHARRPEPAPDVGESSERVGDARARGLLHQVRAAVAKAEAQGGHWQDVVDLLRPRAPELWMGLSPVEQSRFKRHLERVWNTHRHRMAPQVGDEVERLLEAGLFHVHSGQVVAAEKSGSSLSLAVRSPSADHLYHWATDWLVNCTGPDANLFRDDQVLMNRLRSRRLAGPGPLAMGVGTDLTGHVLDACGEPLDWLWALGSLRQGQLFESTAVPEIRGQAQDIAEQVLRHIRADQRETVTLGERTLGERTLGERTLEARLLEARMASNY
jgi:uncharacterized NAD(P)/FAD-binding protein YdhS